MLTPDDTSRPWAPHTSRAVAGRVAFRYAASYIALYLTSVVPQRAMSWVAVRILGLGVPTTVFTGSGDRTIDWVGVICTFAAASIVTVLWMTIDRRGTNDARLDRWLRVWVRFALGGILVSYGMMKVIPLQMPAPSLIRLLQPFGQFSPMGVLWSAIGASAAYERFAGGAELLAAVLLFVPRTARMGAIVALAVTCHIFVLNMTYDVPVKLYSFHLILLSVFLLAPDVPRLANVLLLNRPAQPAKADGLGSTPGRRRAWLLVQVVVGAAILVQAWAGAVQSWTTRGGGAARSVLYGIWTVDEMSIDDIVRPPLETDRERWHRVVFDRPDTVTFQRQDDVMVPMGVIINETAGWLQLAPPGWRPTSGPGHVRDRLTFDRPTPDVLMLDGDIAGRRVVMRLSRVDLQSLPLLNRGFHWIQEQPFNR